MKSLKILFAIIITGALFSSCSTMYQDSFDRNQISLEEVVSGYDVWYVDYNKTTGIGDVPYVSMAFTLSFSNGILYANNNIVDIGITGRGLGIDVGTYNTYNGILETNHDIDGANDFEVTVRSNNEIELYNYRENVTYYLIGYQANQFDYDKLFYDNIERFLQEYVAWEKEETIGGATNAFDAENYLGFTSENITTFYSSQDNLGVEDASIINWDYIGDYQIYDVTGYDNLKILTLNYDGGAEEKFELSVINDSKISLYQTKTGTTYTFLGRSFIQYLKTGSSKKSANSLDRKRIKVQRKTIDR